MIPRSSDGAPEQLEFGQARPEDLDALVAIDPESPRAWTRDAFAAELARDAPSLFVLRSSGRALAFAVIRVLVPEMDIVNLAVSLERRRLGLGRFLLRTLLDNALSSGVRTVFLEVREGNIAGRELYRRAGFTESQRRPDFYFEPIEDAILMRLELSGEEGLKGPRNAC